MNILKDIKIAVKLTGEIRRARERGVDLEVRPVPAVPHIKIDYWRTCFEGCLFCEKKWLPVREVFDGFDENTKLSLLGTPMVAGWANRARFWARCLKPALPPRLYHAAMMKLISRYAHCRRVNLGILEV